MDIGTFLESAFDHGSAFLHLPHERQAALDAHAARLQKEAEAKVKADQVAKELERKMKEAAAGGEDGSLMGSTGDLLPSIIPTLTSIGSDSTVRAYSQDGTLRGSSGDALLAYPITGVSTAALPVIPSELTAIPSPISNEPHSIASSPVYAAGGGQLEVVGHELLAKLQKYSSLGPRWSNWQHDHDRPTPSPPPAVAMAVASNTGAVQPVPPSSSTRSQLSKRPQSAKMLSPWAPLDENGLPLPLPADDDDADEDASTSPSHGHLFDEMQEWMLARRAVAARMKKASDLDRRKMQHATRIAEFQEKQRAADHARRQSMLLDAEGKPFANFELTHPSPTPSGSPSASDDEATKAFDFKGIFGINFPLLPFEKGLLRDRYHQYKEHQQAALAQMQKAREAEVLREWELQRVEERFRRIRENEPDETEEEIAQSKREALATLVPLDQTLITMPIPMITFEAAPIIPVKQTLPFALQGDPNMYTDHSLDVRASLRTHPRLLKLIEMFWKTFHEKDSKHGLVKKEYMDVHMKMQKAIMRDIGNNQQFIERENANQQEKEKKPKTQVKADKKAILPTPPSPRSSSANPERPGSTSPKPAATTLIPAPAGSPTASTALVLPPPTEVTSLPAKLKPVPLLPRSVFDPVEAEKLAFRDWTRDTHRSSGNSNGMKLQAFQDAMFELVDLWTETTDPNEYIEFLSVLYARIAKPFGRSIDAGSVQGLTSASGASAAATKARKLSINANLPAAPSTVAALASSLEKSSSVQPQSGLGRWKHLREIAYEGMGVEDIWTRFIEKEKAKEWQRLKNLLIIQHQDDATNWAEQMAAAEAAEAAARELLEAAGHAMAAELNEEEEAAKLQQQAKKKKRSKVGRVKRKSRTSSISEASESDSIKTKTIAIMDESGQKKYVKVPDNEDDDSKIAAFPHKTFYANAKPRKITPTASEESLEKKNADGEEKESTDGATSSTSSELLSSTMADASLSNPTTIDEGDEEFEYETIYEPSHVDASGEMVYVKKTRRIPIVAEQGPSRRHISSSRSHDGTPSRRSRSRSSSNSVSPVSSRRRLRREDMVDNDMPRYDAMGNMIMRRGSTASSLTTITSRNTSPDQSRRASQRRLEYQEEQAATKAMKEQEKAERAAAVAAIAAGKKPSRHASYSPNGHRLSHKKKRSKKQPKAPLDPAVLEAQEFAALLKAPPPPIPPPPCTLPEHEQPLRRWVNESRGEWLRRLEQVHQYNSRLGTIEMTVDGVLTLVDFNPRDPKWTAHRERARWAHVRGLTEEQLEAADYKAMRYALALQDRKLKHPELAQAAEAAAELKKQAAAASIKPAVEKKVALAPDLSLPKIEPPANIVAEPSDVTIAAGSTQAAGSPTPPSSTESTPPPTPPLLAPESSDLVPDLPETPVLTAAAPTNVLPPTPASTEASIAPSVTATTTTTATTPKPPTPNTPSKSHRPHGAHHHHRDSRIRGSVFIPRAPTDKRVHAQLTRLGLGGHQQTDGADVESDGGFDYSDDEDGGNTTTKHPWLKPKLSEEERKAHRKRRRKEKKRAKKEARRLARETLKAALPMPDVAAELAAAATVASHDVVSTAPSSAAADSLQTSSPSSPSMAPMPDHATSSSPDQGDMVWKHLAREMALSKWQKEQIRLTRKLQGGGGESGHMMDPDGTGLPQVFEVTPLAARAAQAAEENLVPQLPGVLPRRTNPLIRAIVKDHELKLDGTEGDLAAETTSSSGVRSPNSSNRASKRKSIALVDPALFKTSEYRHGHGGYQFATPSTPFRKYSLLITSGPTALPGLLFPDPNPEDEDSPLAPGHLSSDSEAETETTTDPTALPPNQHPLDTLNLQNHPLHWSHSPSELEHAKAKEEKEQERLRKDAEKGIAHATQHLRSVTAESIRPSSRLQRQNSITQAKMRYAEATAAHQQSQTPESGGRNRTPSLSIPAGSSVPPSPDLSNTPAGARIRGSVSSSSRSRTPSQSAPGVDWNHMDEKLANIITATSLVAPITTVQDPVRVKRILEEDEAEERKEQSQSNDSSDSSSSGSESDSNDDSSDYSDSSDYTSSNYTSADEDAEDHPLSIRQISPERVPPKKGSLEEALHVSPAVISSGNNASATVQPITDENQPVTIPRPKPTILTQRHLKNMALAAAAARATASLGSWEQEDDSKEQDVSTPSDPFHRPPQHRLLRELGRDSHGWSTHDSRDGSVATSPRGSAAFDRQRPHPQPPTNRASLKREADAHGGQPSYRSTIATESDRSDRVAPYIPSTLHGSSFPDPKVYAVLKSKLIGASEMERAKYLRGKIDDYELDQMEEERKESVSASAADPRRSSLPVGVNLPSPPVSQPNRFHTSWDILGRHASRDWMGRYYDELAAERSGVFTNTAPILTTPALDPSNVAIITHQHPPQTERELARLEAKRLQTGAPASTVPPSTNVGRPRDGSQSARPYVVFPPLGAVDQSNLTNLRKLARISAVKQSKLLTTTYLSPNMIGTPVYGGSATARSSRHRDVSPPRIAPAAPISVVAATVEIAQPQTSRRRPSQQLYPRRRLSQTAPTQLVDDLSSSPMMPSVPQVEPRLERHIRGLSRLVAEHDAIQQQRAALEKQYKLNLTNPSSTETARTNSMQYAGRTLTEILEQAAAATRTQPTTHRGRTRPA